MAQLLVRNLEESVKAALKKRARHHGRSMEEEVREILRTSVRASARRATPLGTAISELFRDTGLDEPIAELRGTLAVPARLED